MLVHCWDLIQKVGSFLYCGISNSTSVAFGFEMTDNKRDMCCHCGSNLPKSCLKYQCQSCSRLLCENCLQGLGSLDGVEFAHIKDVTKSFVDIKSCKICFELSPLCRSARRGSEKIYPSESPRQSSEPPSPNFCGEGFGGHPPDSLTRFSDASFSDHLSPVSAQGTPNRSDEDEGEDSTSHIFNAPIKYFRDASGVDSNNVSPRHEIYGSVSVGSSPFNSPSRLHIMSDRVGHYVHQEQGGTPKSNDSASDQEQAILDMPARGIRDSENVKDVSIFQRKSEELRRPLDFETDGLIWLPPPPDDINDEVENSFFTYDDDDEVGDSGATFLSASSFDSVLLSKGKQYGDQKEPLRAVVQGHFQALVLQLLQGQGLMDSEEDYAKEWLDIVISIAWQAANFVKPDTSRGGSMDPCDYVKVKCVASGSPKDSKLIKGIVCTKNIKHKRMMSEYKNTKLLLLGGALEYQRVPNQLSSFETLLQQEKDHLKRIVSMIEDHRPNVLLVEKTVSSFAQEHLLAKEISLVLNVKRPLLERIARCTGAIITPSTDHISTTRLGHCELFHLEKILEDREPVNQFNRKPSKTLMFFEGCPRRLGCTVVLRGSSREALKKVKHVVQYGVFAAYHLSLETSFLVDEGASLPVLEAKSQHSVPKSMTTDKAISIFPEQAKEPSVDTGSADLGFRLQESLSDDDVTMLDEFTYRNALSDACDENLTLDSVLDDVRSTHLNVRTLTDSRGQEAEESGEVSEPGDRVIVDNSEASNEYYAAKDCHQSILVSFSSHCMANGTVCERSRSLRVKFYGPSDKPLGRYLRDDLFDQSYLCRSCKEPAEAHVICYTHQHGNLTINVRRLPSVKLPGEQDGKIWMWHRCLRCAHVKGVPPATGRVVMSDSAWGLSFGKFLELSFSNHATGNRVASCGHSLQRDCLRFYGFGSMVAFFRYSPINIFSVHLPPSVLEFGGPGEQSWIRKEAYELLSKAEALYEEISGVLEEIRNKSLSSINVSPDASELHNHVLKLYDMLFKEKNYCRDLLQLADEGTREQDQAAIGILEINHLRHSLVVGSHLWDRRLYLLDSLLKRSSSAKAPDGAYDSNTCKKIYSLDLSVQDSMSRYPKLGECVREALPSDNEGPNSSPLEHGLEENCPVPARLNEKGDQICQDEEDAGNVTPLERGPSAASILSNKIDSAWSGTQLLDSLNTDVSETIPCRQVNQEDNPALRRVMSPARVHSFDSAQRLQERMRRGLPPSSLHLSTLRSFHASGDYRNMVRDPVANMKRTISQVSPREAEQLSLSSTAFPAFLTSIPLLPEGARLMVRQNGQTEIVVAVYDDEPTSIISYALISKDYENWIADRANFSDGGSKLRPVNSVAPDISTWQSLGSLDLDYMNYGSNSSADALGTVGSPHLRVLFEDESSNSAGRVKFSVTCYFAKDFDALRRRCCPSEVDFIHSLSRCRRWNAQGGKSNVYFAKSFDERFIIKQVTKTELDSFEEFAPGYFKYLSDAISSGSPTCLAKVLGMYQVTVKYPKGGKEVKMDLMVMENIFFGRSISKVYDLKGSARSRYNSDTTGANKVMLDMNLLETLRTNPIFLMSKAKRSLERAVWNDTSFLASVDVMDYSLLVGVDEEKKELVLGIIDFMRQYTWDKHLETWVKASGILGGPKNASPTIVSPKQYKKRFRKAMTTYFLTVPDQWSS